MSDPINPSHYDGTAALEAMVGKHGLLAVYHFCQVSPDKYEYRAGRKPNTPAEIDHGKAAQYREFAAMLAGRLPQALLPPARLSYIQEVAEALEPLGQGLVRELLADREALGGYYAGREREREERVGEELATLAAELSYQRDWGPSQMVVDMMERLKIKPLC